MRRDKKKRRHSSDQTFTCFSVLKIRRETHLFKRAGCHVYNTLHSCDFPSCHLYPLNICFSSCFHYPRFISSSSFSREDKIMSRVSSQDGHQPGLAQLAAGSVLREENYIWIWLLSPARGVGAAGG